jgi:hypothetical protein
VTWSLRDARTRRDEESAQRTFEDASARWEQTAGRLGELIDTAHTLGTGDAPLLPPGCPITLKRGESAFFWLTRVSLVETSIERDECADGYSGCSLQVLHNVEWHVGGKRADVEAARESPSVVDVGSVTITNQRVVFQGAKHVRVWRFTKLLGTRDDVTTPVTAIAVSNFHKVFAVRYTEAEAEEFRFRLHLALAVYRGDRPLVVAALEREREQHDAVRPVFAVPGGAHSPISSRVRDFAAWPAWLRISGPIVAVVLTAILLGVVTEGQAKPFFAAQTQPSPFVPTTTGGPTATTAPRTTGTKVARTKPGKRHPRATSTPTTQTGVTARRRVAAAATTALPPAPRRGRRHAPTGSPPTTTEPPTTTPPTTEPPTTTPPTTEPPTTTPPTTEPPTTTPPTTDPQEAVQAGAPCSQLGAIGHTGDGATVMCVVDLAGFQVELFWMLL